MKWALLGLLLIVAWLPGFPAYSATYTYRVDYSFTSVKGEVTGFITTSCDSCDLDASNILSWSFTASDGASGSSSEPGSGISTTDFMLEATPTGNRHRRQRRGRSVYPVLQRHSGRRSELLHDGGAGCLQSR
jgi:hypothetical protein